MMRVLSWYNHGQFNIKLPKKVYKFVSTKDNKEPSNKGLCVTSDTWNQFCSILKHDRLSTFIWKFTIGNKIKGKVFLQFSQWRSNKVNRIKCFVKTKLSWKIDYGVDTLAERIKDVHFRMFPVSLHSLKAHLKYFVKLQKIYLKNFFQRSSQDRDHLRWRL